MASLSIRERIGFGLDHGADLPPEVVVGAARGRPSQEYGQEAIDHRLVVDKCVRGPFGSCHEVAKGHPFGPLGVLDNAVEAGGNVEAVPFTMEDIDGSSCQERARGIGAGAVSGGADPSGLGVYPSGSSPRAFLS